VYGHLIYCGITGKTYIFPKDSDANESEKIGQEGCLYIVTFEVIPETVGQFTGLKDRNGVEIFEGDVVRFVGRSCLVNFVQNDCAFRIEVDNKGSIALRKARSNDLQVIGNIHDKES
jgi:uncharacterized phage protein (TIGR01671 family)